MLDNSEVTTETTQVYSQADSSQQNDEAKVERYKQQLKGREDEARQAQEARKTAEERAERYRQSLLSREYNRVYSNDGFNADEFRKLKKEDPELADELACKFTRENGESIWTADELLNYVSGSIPSQNMDRQSIIDEAKKQMMEDIEQRATLAKVISRFGNLPADKQQEAETYYKKITGGRKISAEESQEFADMASMYVMKGQVVAQRKDDRLASMGSMSFWGISNQSNGSNNGVSDADVAEYLNGIGMNSIAVNHSNVKLF